MFVNSEDNRVSLVIEADLEVRIAVAAAQRLDFDDAA